MYVVQPTPWDRGLTKYVSLSNGQEGIPPAYDSPDEGIMIRPADPPTAVPKTVKGFPADESSGWLNLHAIPNLHAPVRM